MKQKILIVTGIAVIFALVISITLFFVLTKDDETDNGSLTISVSYLEGTWRIARLSDAAMRDEYLVFDENLVTKLNKTNDKNDITSSYNISESNTLLMPDISKEFLVEITSENILKIIDSQTQEVWNLLRCFDGACEYFSNNQLDGNWNVLFHAGQLSNGETMSFNKGIFTNYRNSSSEPYIKSEYTLSNNGYLEISKLNREFEVIQTGENTYGFIETDTGYIWEIEKID